MPILYSLPFADMVRAKILPTWSPAVRICTYTMPYVPVGDVWSDAITSEAHTRRHNRNILEYLPAPYICTAGFTGRIHKSQAQLISMAADVEKNS